MQQVLPSHVKTRHVHKNFSEDEHRQQYPWSRMHKCLTSRWRVEIEMESDCSSVLMSLYDLFGISWFYYLPEHRPFSNRKMLSLKRKKKSKKKLNKHISLNDSKAVGDRRCVLFCVFSFAVRFFYYFIFIRFHYLSGFCHPSHNTISASLPACLPTRQQPNETCQRRLLFDEMK